MKLVLADGKFTYEPSYNLLRKAPSLSVARPLGPGKYKVSGREGPECALCTVNLGLGLQRSLCSV